jgi:hypothetical protein
MPGSGRKIHLLYSFNYSRHDFVKIAASEWPRCEQGAEIAPPPAPPHETGGL